MTPLRMYLKKHYQGSDGLKSFADGLGCSKATVNAIASGHSDPSCDLAIKIDKLTNGEISVESLRPEVDWNYLRGTRKRLVAKPKAKRKKP